MIKNKLNSFNFTKKRTVTDFLPLFCVVLFVLFVTGITEVSATEGLLFLLFQILGMLTPGMALILVLFSERLMDRINSSIFLAYSYALGYVINLAVYFVFMVTRQKRFILPAFSVLAGVSLVIVIKNTRKIRRLYNSRYDDLGSRITAIFVAALLLLRFICNIPQNRLFAGGAMSSNKIYQDALYHVGDVISAVHSYPMKDFRWFTDYYFYHYFSSVQVAFESIVTGISAYKLDMFFAIVQPAILLVFALYAFISSIDMSKAGKIWTMVAVLFTTGVEQTVMATYGGHLYTVSLGFDLGLAFALLTMSVFALRINNGFDDVSDKVWLSDKTRVFFLAMLFFFVGVGLKGPCMLLVLFGMGCVCIYWLFTKEYKAAFSYGCSLIVVFFAEFFVILSNGIEAISGDAGDTGLEVLVPLKGLHVYPLGELYDSLVEKGYPSIVGNLAMLLKWVIYIQPAIILSVLVFAIWKIFSRWRNRTKAECSAEANKVVFYEDAVKSTVGKGIFHSREKDLINLACISMGLFGIFMTLTSVQSGCSEMYFVMVSFAFFAAYLGRELWGNGDVPKLLKYCVCLFTAIGCVLLFVSIGDNITTGVNMLVSGGKTSVEASGDNSVKDSENAAGTGINADANNVNDMEKSIGIANTVRLDEYDAYMWIKDNTEEDAVVLTNMYLQHGQETNLITGCLTERFCWIDGWVYTSNHTDDVKYRRNVAELFFAGDDMQARLENEGVDYIIDIKEISPDFAAPDYVELVYDNPGVAVYRLL